MQKKMAEEAKKRLGILLDMGLWDEITYLVKKILTKFCLGCKMLTDILAKYLKIRDAHQ